MRYYLKIGYSSLNRFPFHNVKNVTEIRLDKCDLILCNEYI